MSLKIQEITIPKLIVKNEQERLWLAIDAARKNLSRDRVEAAVAALWQAVGPARTDVPAAIAIVLVAAANFSRDAILAIEAGDIVTNPHRDDRVQAIPQYFSQILEAAINDSRARRMLSIQQPQGHA